MLQSPIRLAIGFTLILAASAQASDWTQFLGPFGTSVSPEKGIITPWPAQVPVCRPGRVDKIKQIEQEQMGGSK